MDMEIMNKDIMDMEIMNEWHVFRPFDGTGRVRLHHYTVAHSNCT